MPEPGYVIAAVLISGGITWALRALPFVMLAPLRESRLLTFLGERMPVGIMLILAVYTLREVELAKSTEVVAAIVALGVTIGIQLWRRKMIHSIFAGTAVYVVLMTSVGSS